MYYTNLREDSVNNCELIWSRDDEKHTRYVIYYKIIGFVLGIQYIYVYIHFEQYLLRISVRNINLLKIIYLYILSNFH